MFSSLTNDFDSLLRHKIDGTTRTLSSTPWAKSQYFLHLELEYTMYMDRSTRAIYMADEWSYIANREGA